jgi:hypothetical protein
MVFTQGRAGRTSLSFKYLCTTSQLFVKYEPYYWTGEARSAGGKLVKLQIIVKMESAACEFFCDELYEIQKRKLSKFY